MKFIEIQTSPEKPNTCIMLENHLSTLHLRLSWLYCIMFFMLPQQQIGDRQFVPCLFVRLSRSQFSKMAIAGGFKFHKNIL